MRQASSQETFALALHAGLEKLSVQMTVDQRAAITLFESLGFKVEALLRDDVKNVNGQKHDIVVLGHNVAQVQAQLEAYGLPGAVSPYSWASFGRFPRQIARLFLLSRVCDYRVMVHRNMNIASHH